MKRFSFARLVGMATLSLALAFTLVQPALALSGSDWRPGRIIDDAIFYNKSSMSVAQIQQFLNAKVPTCDNWGTGSYAGTTRRAYSEARGIKFPLTCLKDYHENTTTKENNLEGRPIPGGAKSAANIIWDAAQQYNINPQALIVLLQKEQGLVLDSWPWPDQFRSATGFGCPDTAACNSQYYGFYNQVQNAARQLRRYATFPNDYNHIAGRNNSVRFNPNVSCGSSTVYIENTATASLYNYTPYQPNQAALGNLYGTGDGCSAYGNRNFWRDFNAWFGLSFGDGFVLAISDDPNDLRQWVLYGTIKQHIPDSQTKIAWGLQEVDLVTMSAAALGSINTGPALDRLMRQPNGPIYFVDAGRRYRIPWDSSYGAWNLQGLTVSTVSAGLYHVTADGGELNSFSVKDPGSSTVYMVDGRNGSGQTVLRPYANDTVRFAIEGTNAPYMTVSADYWDKINDAIGATLTHTKMSVGGTSYQVMNRFKFTLSSDTAALYPGAPQEVSAATRARLADGGGMSYLIRPTGSPAVYAIDAGTRHHIQSPDLLKAWRTGGRDVQVVNDQFASLIPTGTAITNYFADNGGQLYLVDGAKMPVPSALGTAYRNTGAEYGASSQLLNLFTTTPNQLTGFVKSRSGPQVYLVDNSGQRRHILSPDVATAWGAWQAGVVELSDYILASMATAASPGLFVSDGTTDYVMDDGKKVSVDDSVKTNWGLGTAQSFTDGTLARFSANGALGNAMQASGGYFMISQGKSYGTTDPLIAEAWNIEVAPQRSKALLGLVSNSMLTRFVRSSINGDNRTFLVDDGVWYNLPGQHSANFGVNSQPVMQLNPSLGGTITDWSSAIVKNPQGKYFVIDNGGRRYFPNVPVQDHWTNFGQLAVPTVTNGLVLSLPERGIVERAVKGSSPAVYSVPSATKRHILSPGTYNQQYGVHAQVSDNLLNALPSGSSIP